MSHNTWMHRLTRVGVRPLAGTPVTPNHLTSLRLATGLGATAAFAVGDAAWSAWGAALFMLSIFLDRADGELARLNGKTSPAGHRYDIFSDAAVNALVFLGLGAGLREGALGAWAPLLGLAAGAGVTAVLLMVLRVEALEGEGSGELEGAAGFDADDALLIVPVLVWLDYTEVLVVAAAIGAPAFAIFMALKFRKRLSDAR